MNHSIPKEERLIVALDVHSYREAAEIINTIGCHCNFYKIGLQLLMSGDYFRVLELLKSKDKRVFCDIKFFDVPATVGKAVFNLTRRYEPDFLTVHGNDDIITAAVESRCLPTKVLAVTCLTSLDQNDINDLGFECSPEKLVLSRAQRALELGCDGVISSGLEVQKIRQELRDDKFMVVCPGIRPVVNNDDDQKRTVDVNEAFIYGADYIVVGRPITEAESPMSAAQLIQTNITQMFKRWCG